MTVALENDALHGRADPATAPEAPVPWLVGESALRAALERLPGVVYALDPRASPPRLLYVSPKIEELLGYPSAHWRHEPGLWTQVIHPEDRERVLAAHAEGYAAGHPLACEYRMHARCGRVVWVSDVCTPVLDSAGRLLGMQGLLTDVTERRHAEAEMREWHEEVERLVELQVAAQTAAAIAHELNQPLNAIASYHAAALRLLRAGNPQPERLLHALEQGAEQVQRAGQAMRALLALLHKGETPTEGVFLNAAVREAVSILIADGYIDGVKAELDLMPELPRVRANRLQVQKVLVNLLRNAVEAIHGSGRTRGRVRVRTELAEGMARLCVEDDGPGLAPQAAERVFEPFFTTKAHGIGMGLAISRALILAHGGQMWVDEGVAQGCRFCFTLPLAE